LQKQDSICVSWWSHLSGSPQGLRLNQTSVKVFSINVAKLSAFASGIRHQRAGSATRATTACSVRQGRATRSQFTQRHELAISQSTHTSAVTSVRAHAHRQAACYLSNPGQRRKWHMQSSVLVEVAYEQRNGHLPVFRCITNHLSDVEAVCKAFGCTNVMGLAGTLVCLNRSWARHRGKRRRGAELGCQRKVGHPYSKYILNMGLPCSQAGALCDVKHRGAGSVLPAADNEPFALGPRPHAYMGVHQQGRAKVHGCLGLCITGYNTVRYCMYDVTRCYTRACEAHNPFATHLAGSSMDGVPTQAQLSI
jgi:hypothetical protein